MMENLELDRIGKVFGGLEIIKDLSLSVKQGEFIVIVGPSGCGKSTLLRMVAGLEEISSGELRIHGKRANELPPQKRNIALVFQSYALFPHLTVAQNILFGPQVRGEDKVSSQNSLKKAVDILNLGPYLDRMPSELSGGQRQRVAMGRAIVRDPDLFLFDEPLSNLDAHLRGEMRGEIKSMQKRLGTTTLYVTHDQVEAMTMADRIVIMNEGRIEQFGTPLELYDHPANKFVAGFLGSPAMNFLDGTYARNDSRAWIDLGHGQKLDVKQREIQNGTPVAAGIRPDMFSVQSTPGVASFQIDFRESTGSETHLFGKVNDHTVRCAMQGRPDCATSDRLWLTVDPDNVHLFDHQTGNRI